MVRLTRAIAVAAAIGLLAGCGPPNFVMMTDNMAPTIEQGDIIAIDMEAYEEGAPQRGEMVAYHAPDNPEGKMLMGRVVAVEGDSVTVRDGRLLLNGEPVAKSYASEEMQYEVEALAVPEGHVYILGDNRNEAHDSHVFGPVPTDLLDGQITDVQKPPGSE